MTKNRENTSQGSKNSEIDAFLHRISQGVRIRAPNPRIPAKKGIILPLRAPFKGPLMVLWCKSLGPLPRLVMNYKRPWDPGSSENA